MKIRNDFVTNSSSTSYIFKDKPLLSEKETLRKKAEEEIEKEFKLDSKYNTAYARNHKENRTYWLNKYFDEELEYLQENLNPLRDCDANTLGSIYFWFMLDIFEIIIFGFDDYRNRNREPYDEESLIAEIKKGDLSDDVLTKLSGTVALYNMLDSDDEKYPETFTEETAERCVDEVIFDMHFYRYDWKKVMKTFIFTHYNELIKKFESFVGLTAGEIFELVLGECYVYFEEYETVTLELREGILSLPSCIFGCSHMG